ncbi:hypothetical protein TthHB8_04430 [Thermus thermophilus]|nr:hypothetical protein TthHB8_04430 [Thermus thermophilus]
MPIRREIYTRPPDLCKASPQGVDLGEGPGGLRLQGRPLLLEPVPLGPDGLRLEDHLPGVPEDQEEAQVAQEGDAHPGEDGDQGGRLAGPQAEEAVVPLPRPLGHLVPQVGHQGRKEEDEEEEGPEGHG